MVIRYSACQRETDETPTPPRRTVVILATAALVGTGLAEWYGTSEQGWDVLGAFQDPGPAEAALATPPSLVVVSACPDRRLVGAATGFAASAPVLVLVGDADAVVEAGFLRAGAAGVLRFAVGREELLSVSASLVRGSSVASAEAIRMLAAPLPERPTFTDRQVDILVGLARGRSTRELAKELVLTESTVKTHIGRLATRLGLAGRKELEVLARQLLADDEAYGRGGRHLWRDVGGRTTGLSSLPLGAGPAVRERARSRALRGFDAEVFVGDLAARIPDDSHRVRSLGKSADEATIGANEAI